MSTKRGMGTWFRRGNVWWIKYHKGGKPFRESSKSTKESVATALLKRRLSEIDQGTFREPKYRRRTFEDLCEQLLADYRINQKKSLWRVDLSLKHLKQFFGGMRAGDIDTSTIRRYIENRRSEEASNGTISRELAALKRMYRLAAQDGIITRIPHVPMLEENNVRTGFLEHRQYEGLLEELPAYLRPVLTMAYWTGCRKSEILNLKWTQVDFLQRQITLDAGTTKNNEPRIIPMGGELYRAILALRPVGVTNRADAEFVFTNSGRRIRYIYNAWREATTRAGLPGLLLHDCRRTAVRNFVRAGVSDKVARTISGHKTRSVFDRYNIVDERDLHDATAKLERHVASRLGTVWAQSGISEVNSRENSGQLSGGEEAVTH